MRRSVLLIGATSSISKAIAHRMAKEGTALHLVARDRSEVERIARDITIRYQCPVSWDTGEAVDYDAHAQLISNAVESLGSLDGVVVSLGELGEQQETQVDFDLAQRIIHSNYTGVASMLTHVANYLERQKNGFIIGISSVAGDRGRSSNYIYGSAKGALSLFLQGMRSRLAKSNVHVMTVKPGFVDTKMTFGKSGMFLVANPQQIAKAIVCGLEKKKNVIYTPWFWRGIMSIIRSIPESIFKKLKL